MTGTERDETGARDRFISTTAADADIADGACMAADRGIEEKKSTMQRSKEMIAAPARGPMNPDGKVPGGPPHAGTSSDLPGHLGAQLRAIYGELVNEPVPDKFFHLLKELEAKEGEDRS